MIIKQQCHVKKILSSWTLGEGSRQQKNPDSSNYELLIKVQYILTIVQIITRTISGAFSRNRLFLYLSCLKTLRSTLTTFVLNVAYEINRFQVPSEMYTGGSWDSLVLNQLL